MTFEEVVQSFTNMCQCKCNVQLTYGSFSIDSNHSSNFEVLQVATESNHDKV